MLRRVYRPAKSLTCLHARSYTASPTSVYPYKKLRAFPFVMSPETAQRRMANHAQRLCGGPYFLRTTFRDLFPDTWDIKFKRPTLFAAVYFPAWLISGTMFSKAIFDDTKDLTLFFFSKITYLPGCDLSTMSTPVFWSYELSDIEPVPLTENLLTQHDLRVNCVPFNTSPFSVLDLCSSVSEDGFSLKPGVKIIPHIVDDFVAMPVLLPLYVATYADENHDSGDVLTLYIQAHSNDGNIKADQDQLLKFLKKKDNKEPIEVYPTVEGKCRRLGRQRNGSRRVLVANARLVRKHSEAGAHGELENG
ncbi:hypothetical protein GALMADRAFT_462968 [Galerina marginata CBS 339.88]|uniref:Uncharacterized protein n=1 Tax=Galerina marginata (strain CBS 339.88) TaxID=685588 RepID=A0A067TAX6_GALM3|nr:hypothetical protein GALMADRAFT_462968 [Galerina marginata CBS 339.88]